MHYYSVYAHNNEIITHNKYIAVKHKQEIDHLFSQLIRWYPCVVINECTEADYNSGKIPWDI